MQWRGEKSLKEQLLETTYLIFSVLFWGDSDDMNTLIRWQATIRATEQ